MKIESKHFLSAIITLMSFSVMSQVDSINVATKLDTSLTAVRVNSNDNSNVSNAFQQTKNTAYGTNALTSLNGGTYNVAFGANAGFNLTSATSNTLIGHQAGYRVTTGNYNTLIGTWASDYMTTGDYNTTFGHATGAKLTTGSKNVFLGSKAGSGFYQVGSNSVFIGYMAGYNNPGAGNIFIGYNAGYDEPGSDRLVIDNRNDNTSPFIFGNLATDQLQLNASVKIGKTNLGDPTETLDVDGTMRIRNVNPNNALTQLLVTDNSGKVFYRDMNTLPGGGSGSSQWQLSNTNIMFNTGQVAIATTTFANGYALSIGGKAIMEEVKVQLESQGWPDYVFASDYKLLPLGDLKSFIVENHHLPEIPTAEQVETNGIELGDMNARLLKKIEELTLHLIAMDERLKELEDENSQLKSGQKNKK